MFPDFGLSKRGLIDLDRRRRNEPILAAITSSNLPVVVVKEQMMMFAEQDAVGDIRFAVVGGTFIDVVSFGP
ncbi:MAG TPA: hypothetical protein VHZ81_10480 [Galbitalea sp.]|jgi:hypothetical protein|nr:hypothetical protein [Galbitalea sp.]